MENEAVIIIMAKQPKAGKTKTRLCPPFTLEQAAALFEALLRDTITLAAGLSGVDLAIAITPPESRAYFAQISSPGTLLLPIEGADIGKCLDGSLRALLERGYRKALALNADGPSLPRAYLREAVAALDSHDLVLGPGEDGGYYLIGLKQPQPLLFEDIPWSSAEVFTRTLGQAARLGLDTAHLPAWYDVDSPADARRLLEELQNLPADRLVYCRRFFAGCDPFENVR